MATCSTYNALTHVLEPHDWYWATWRDLPPLTQPVRPFDQAEALEHLAHLAHQSTMRPINWQHFAQTPPFGRVEAHFWLFATHNANHWDARELAQPHPLSGIDTPTKELLLAVIREEHFDGNVSANQAFSLLMSERSPRLPIKTALVAPFLTLDDLFHRLATYDVKRGSRYLISNALDGMREYIVPTLDRAARARLGILLEPHLEAVTLPLDPTQPLPTAIELAAMLGVQQPFLRSVINTWSDTLFGSSVMPTHNLRPHEVIFGLDDPQLVEHTIRRLDLLLIEPLYTKPWLAHTELSALDLLCNSALAVTSGWSKEIIKTLAAIEHPAVAPHMLRLIRERHAPDIARQWIAAHPNEAIAGVLPLLNDGGQAAADAQHVLRRFARHGYAPHIIAQLAHAHPALAEHVQHHVLDPVANEPAPFDEHTTPAWLVPKKSAKRVPELPKDDSWIDCEDLPPIIVGNRQLNQLQVIMLLTSLRRRSEHATQLLQHLQTYADPASLAAFGWALWQQWCDASAPGASGWIVGALGRLGNDTTATELAQQLAMWPADKQRHVALKGVEILALIGSDVAWFQIFRLAYKAKLGTVRTKASRCLERAAKERNLTRDAFEDQIAPTFGLDAHGNYSLPYGPRTFQFALGSNLKPQIRDPRGVSKTNLPPANRSDDPALVARAQTTWNTLKRNVGDIIALHTPRLQQAMRTGRRWNRVDVERFIVQHPVLHHLAHLLIWGSYSATNTLLAPFRITEERTYADVQDHPLILDDDATVGIVHPVELSVADRARWETVFGDYHLIPPFAQLARPVYALTETEKQQTTVQRFVTTPISPYKALSHKVTNSWQTITQGSEPTCFGIYRIFAHLNTTAVLIFPTSVSLEDISTAPPQPLGTLHFIAGAHALSTVAELLPLSLSTVHPIAISETINDLVTISAHSVQIRP